MTDKRADIIRKQAKSLHEAEAQIEQAVISVANLTGSLAQARIDAKISMIEGVDVMQNLIETLKGLQDARRTIVRAHGGLFEISAKLGFATTAVGGQTEKLYPTKGQLDLVPISVANDIRQVS